MRPIRRRCNYFKRLAVHLPSKKPGTVSDALAVKDVAGSRKIKALKRLFFRAQEWVPKWEGDDIHTEDAEVTARQRRNQRGWRIEDGKGGPRR